MAPKDSKTKRRSGRDAGAKKSSKPTSAAASAPALATTSNVQLRSPWVPLFWMLVPLVVAVIYGVLTRH